MKYVLQGDLISDYTGLSKISNKIFIDNFFEDDNGNYPTATYILS